TGRSGRADTAMTGEITLRGAVLPIGGVKEKVLGAHRAGLRRVVLPERNRKDLVDVPAEVQREMEFVFCRRVEEVIEAALEPASMEGEALPMVPLGSPLGSVAAPI